MSITKETLLNEFTSNSDTITKIKGNNSRIVDYYAKKYGYSHDGNKIITDFIESNFYYSIQHDNEDLTLQDIKEMFENVLTMEVYEYVDDMIDIYDEDLMNSYSYFQEFVDKSNGGESIVEVMRRAQYEGYIKLFYDIREKFVLFLENKIDEIE